ncbi:hypothetical protein [Sunxiuqinia sp. sy24]|uniref:hypothetical protein n=1 Tax=Sunxiuqinia sp. sy24 TaxID=3461495 RepID=UPI004045E5F3
MKQKVLEIEIKLIEEFFPNLLFNKLKLLGIKTIYEFVSFPTEEFRKTKTVGQKAIDLFIQFKDKVTEEPEYFYDAYLRKTTYLKLPSNIEDLATISFLELFKNVVIEYLNILEKTHLRDIILLGYGINSKKYTREDIGCLHGYTTERVRQLQVKLLSELGHLMNGNKIENPKVIVKDDVVKINRNIITRLFQDPVHSLNSLQECLKNEFQEPFSDEKNNLLLLFLDIIKIIPCGNVETIFTDAELFVSDKSIKAQFLKISLIIKDTLKEAVLPMTEIDVIIQVRKKFKKADGQLIKYALNLLPEIESFESSGEFYFQLKFDKLGNARHYAFRVLSETGKVMYIDEIVSEINNRLSSSSSHRIYDRHSLALASDKRFIALQKTGYWGLKDWDENTDKLEDLIRKTLFKLNKPSSSDEIIQNIHDIRPQAKYNSLMALIGKNCLAVEGELFILPEWKSRYTSLIFQPKRNRIKTKEPRHHQETREKIVQILKIKAERKLRANEIISKLKASTPTIKRQLVYKLFEDEKFFIKSTDEFGKLVIELKQKVKPTRIAIEKYNWEEVKVAFTREISKIFDEPKQPNYSQTFQEGLNIFYDLIVYKTAESNLDGLEDRLLPTLEKYFTKSNDRNDKLNYLKQITTSLDAILKKILFLVNQSDYRWIINNNKGLNAVIVKLSKLDKNKNRFRASINDALEAEFGKFCYLSYTNRNIDTHNARDWSEREIVEIINSCLVFYLYATFEYASEIKTII